MKIKILESASEDLKKGFLFYEDVSPGLGTHLSLNSLNLLIHCYYTREFIVFITESIDCYLSDFPLQYIMKLKMN